MLDHVVDQEMDLAFGLNASEELATAITLLTCSFAVACEAAHGASGNRSGVSLLQHFHTNFISACAGQLLDLRLQHGDLATTDEALRMTSLKAGSLGRLAAAFGAGIATEDLETISLFGEFGFNLFTYLQLIDDQRDACSLGDSRSDLAQRKQTLPLAFFYHSLVEWQPRKSDDTMRQAASENIQRNPLQAFEDCGARTFCAIVAEVFLNRAKASLASLNESGWRTEDLERLVIPLGVGWQGLLAAR